MEALSLGNGKSAGQYFQDHLIYVQFLLITKMPDEKVIYMQRLMWNAEKLVRVTCIEQQHKNTLLSLWKDHIQAIFDKPTEDSVETTAMKLAQFYTDRSAEKIATRRQWEEQFSIYTQLLRDEMESYQKNRDVVRSLNQFDYCMQVVRQIGFLMDQLTIRCMTVSQIKFHMRNINYNVVLALRHGRLNRVNVEMAKLKTWTMYRESLTTLTTQDKRTLKTFANKLKRTRMSVMQESDQITTKQNRGALARTLRAD